MADIFRWSGDGLTAGALTTSSAGTGDTAPGSILGSAGPQIAAGGTRSPRLSFAASPATDQSGAQWDYSAATALGARIYFTTGSALPTSGNLPVIFQALSGMTVVVYIDYTSTGRFNLRDGSTLLDQTSSGTIVANETYRLELTVNHGTGVVALGIYAGESTTPLDTLSGTSAVLGASTSMVRLGKLNSATSPTHYIDDILVTDTATMPGPWVDPAPPATPSPFKRWDGSQYVDLDAYRWNGTGYTPIHGTAI